MGNIHQIDGAEANFRAAYYNCAYDLHVAQGGAGDSFVPPKDEWYLDSRLRILAWISEAEIQGFIIYSPGAFFYSDTDGEILDIWVAGRIRRKGVGRKLATKALDQLHGRIGFQVYAENTASLRFWESLAAQNGLVMTREASTEASEAVWRLTITKP